MPLRGFYAQDKAAIFDEPNQTGEVDDFDAPRNAPVKNPLAHLSRLYIHSDFGLLEVAAEGSATISHDSVGAADSPSGPILASNGFTFAAHTDDHLLLTHNLGYEPYFRVVWSGNAIEPGTPVQSVGGGQREITAYATNTQIRIEETASVSDTAMGAVSRTYHVLVFRDPEPVANPSAPLMRVRESDEIFSLGHERIRSDRKYLQIAPGGSPFGMSVGVNVDNANGAPRILRADGTAYDPYPSNYRLRFDHAHYFSWFPEYSLGAAMNYNGSLTSVAAIMVQAP